MNPHEEGSSDLTRREFFRSVPGEIFKGLQSFWNVEPSIESDPKELRVSLDITRCLAWGGMTCQLCYLSCPLRDKAIVMEDAKPVVFLEACNGCGICVDACRSVNDPPSLAMKEKGGKPIE